MAPPADPASAAASALVAFVRSLGGSAGIERSCKIGPGGIDASRFLLSFAADRRTVPATIRFAERMGLPAETGYAAAAESAAFLHLGYEESRGRPGFKAYCERAAGSGGSAPLYTAWKWLPGDAHSLAIDDYRIADGDAIAEAFGEAATLASACAALRDRARDEEGEPMLLAVQRRGAARRSFDLRLYGAGWRVDAAAALLGVAETAFAQDGLAAKIMALAGDARLGHVSGGRDDRDAAFLTVYFGAQELR